VLFRILKLKVNRENPGLKVEKLLAGAELSAILET
jgi:hypothetical protein